MERRDMDISFYIRTALVTALVGLVSSTAFASGVSLDRWEAKLRATDGYSTARFDLGVRAGATDGLDLLYDARAMMGSGIQAYFDHPEGGGVPYSRDMRSPAMPAQWDFLVDRLRSGRSITVSWSVRWVPAGCDRVDLFLVDHVNGVRIDMRRSASHTWTQVGYAARHFSVEAEVTRSPRPEPPSLKMAVVAGNSDRVVLDWKAPTQNTIAVAAYDIYRIVNGYETKVNDQPLYNARFRDREAPDDLYGVSYEVRSLSHALCPSIPSNRIDLRVPPGQGKKY